MRKLFSFAVIMLSINGFGQNDTIYPPDTLLTPSLISQFNTSYLLSTWTPGYCAVDAVGSDTTFAPCYYVTYQDHYTASIDLCPDNMNEVGGLGLHLATPWLLDSNLFNQMELDGSNIISNMNGYDINYKNLTSGTTTDGGGMNPKYCIEADLFLGTTQTWYQSFQVLLGPIDLPGPGSINYSTAGKIGILKDGVLLEHTPPSSESVPAMQGGIIPIDYCGYHPEPAGFGHFHAIPTGINHPLAANGIDTVAYGCGDVAQENGTGLAGFSFEGIPIYGPLEANESSPTGLDGCNGHFGVTPDYPAGVYHYHASEVDIINNPPCRSNYIPLNPFEYGEWTGSGIGYEELIASDFISLYPNPVSDGILTINGAFDQFVIYDSNGSVLLELNTPNESGIKELDISQFSAGMYFVTAKKANQVFFGKVIKE